MRGPNRHPDHSPEPRRCALTGAERETWGACGCHRPTRFDTDGMLHENGLAHPVPQMRSLWIVLICPLTKRQRRICIKSLTTAEDALYRGMRENVCSNQGGTFGAATRGGKTGTRINDAKFRGTISYPSGLPNQGATVLVAPLRSSQVRPSRIDNCTRKRSEVSLRLLLLFAVSAEMENALLWATARAV
jgi:hypothetical protein